MLEKSKIIAVEEFWESFLIAHPNYSSDTIPVTIFFSYDPEKTDFHADLAKRGLKTACSRLLSTFKEEGTLPPNVGDLLIVRNSLECPICVIRVVKCETVVFENVTEEFVAKIGVEEITLANWKETYWNIFEMESISIEGKDATDHMKVVCMEFEKIWEQENQFFS